MIYVDTPFEMEAREIPAFRAGARYGHRWCHMWTDGPIEELHAFAARLGMRREWFQDHPRLPHYDLLPPGRALAVALGAREVDRAETVRHMRSKARGGAVSAG